MKKIFQSLFIYFILLPCSVFTLLAQTPGAKTIKPANRKKEVRSKSIIKNDENGKKTKSEIENTEGDITVLTEGNGDRKPSTQKTPLKYKSVLDIAYSENSDKSKLASLDDGRRVAGFQGGSIGGTLDLQTRLIYGITDFAIKRAQQEILNAVATEWLTQLKAENTGGLKLELLFASTYGLLNDPDAPLPLSNGPAWKGAFESDLRRIPGSFYEQLGDATVLPNILPDGSDLRKDTRLALFFAGQVAQNRDIISGLNAASLEAQLLNKEPATDFSKTLVITTVLLNGLVTVDENGKPGLESIEKLLNLNHSQRAAFLSLCKEHSRALFAEPFTSLAQNFSDEKKINDFIGVAAQVLRICKAYKQKMDQAKEQGVETGSTGQGAGPIANTTSDVIEASVGVVRTGIAWLANAGAVNKVNAETSIQVLEGAVQISRGVELKQYGEVVAGSLHILNVVDPDNKQEKLKSFIRRYGTFMTDVLSAENAAGVEKAIEQIAEPVTSYKAKYLNNWTGSLTLQPGLSGGAECIPGTRFRDASFVLSPYLPVGLEFTHTFCKGSSFGINFQVFDFGAILGFRVKQTTKPADADNAEEKVEELPAVHFEQLFSPGVFLNYHIPKTPLVIGGGYAYSPKLRKVSSTESEETAASRRLSFHLAVDVPVFYLIRGKRFEPTSCKKK